VIDERETKMKDERRKMKDKEERVTFRPSSRVQGQHSTEGRKTPFGSL
jgi:hypothetical protein